MLAQGGAKGGVKAHQQICYDALERLRRVGHFLFNLLHGERDAFSKVVKNGIERVSGEKGALVVPGFPSPTGIAQWSG